MMVLLYLFVPFFHERFLAVLSFFQQRIGALFDTLFEEKDIRLVFPSEVLKFEKDKKNSFNEIQLSSPKDPIPVKKQAKYNITRWGLTGNSVAINTACYQIY